MSRKNYLFTSESVSEGHPDKVCDQISDAILDAFLANDIKLGIEDDSQTNTRLGCETLTTTNKIVIAGECRGQEPLLKKFNGSTVMNRELLTEIARGHLVAIRVPELGAQRTVRLVFRRTGERSRAAEAFLDVVKAGA